MKMFWLLAAVMVLPGQVLAADATAPVRDIMAAAEANWAENPGDYQDYFSDKRLATLYSAEFAALYRKAADTPAAKEMGSPFDWDVIVNGQDGCPLKNLSIEAAKPEGGVTRVTAKFQGLTCFGTDPEYQTYSETYFNVIEEKGRPVIDDIQTPMENELLSIRNEMTAQISSQ